MYFICCHLVSFPDPQYEGLGMRLAVTLMADCSYITISARQYIYPIDV